MMQYMMVYIILGLLRAEFSWRRGEMPSNVLVYLIVVFAWPLFLGV